MTPEQFKILLKKKERELMQAYTRTLPVKIGTEAVHFVRDNFKQEGFVDKKLERWTPSKRKSIPKHPDRSYKTLSSRRRNLYMSIKKRTKPGEAIIYTDVPYAAAHNEGTNNAGRNRKTKIPKRQFIGDSNALNKKVIKVIEDELKRILKSN